MRTALAPALRPPISIFAGHADSRWYLATGVPSAAYMTNVELLRAAGSPSTTDWCQADTLRSVVWARLKVTVGLAL